MILQAVTILRRRGFTDFQVEINGDNLRYATTQNREQVEAFMHDEAARPYGQRNVLL